MGYKMKGYSYPGKSPLKQKEKDKWNFDINDLRQKHGKSKKKLDHVGTGFMNPPYKDTVKSQKSGVPYEKRQGYHVYKNFDSILTKNKTKK